MGASSRHDTNLPMWSSPEEPWASCPAPCAQPVGHPALQPQGHRLNWKNEVLLVEMSHGGGSLAQVLSGVGPWNWFSVLAAFGSVGEQS